MGKKLAKNTMESFAASPIPSQSINKGIRESGGIKRNASNSNFAFFSDAGIDKSYKELAFMLRLNRMERFKHIEFPASLPNIFTGLRLGAQDSKKNP